MKIVFMLLLSLGVLLNGSAQSGKGKLRPKSHRIVFQMVSKDTADHNALVRQLYNIKKLSPETRLEVVCHGPGLSFIQKEKSLVLDKLADLAGLKTDFVGCEYTMQQKGIRRDQLMDARRTVPGGILEIVEKQEKGWSYIKAGY